MNKSTIRIFCIFVMIMYCLAPISAIDLNQDNNTQLENANNNETESIDETVDDENTEMETVESSPSDDATAIEEEEKEELGVENETANETEDNTENTTDDENEATPGEWTNPDYSVQIENIWEGETANVQVKVDRPVKGWVFMDFRNTNGKYQGVAVDIKNGVGQASVKNLSPGEYEVSTILDVIDGDDMYTCDIHECERKNYDFKVYEKFNHNLNIHVENHTLSEQTKIEISANPSISNPVKVKLSNGQEYTLKLENGTGTITIDDLPGGDYKATVSYEGDKYHKAGQKTTQFSKKEKPELKIMVLGYDCMHMCITGNKLLNDDVKVIVEGDNGYYNETTFKMVNGKTNFHDFGLKPGLYTVKVIYDGNEYMESESTQTIFEQMNIEDNPIDPIPDDHSHDILD